MSKQRYYYSHYDSDAEYLNSNKSRKDVIIEKNKNKWDRMSLYELIILRDEIKDEARWMYCREGDEGNDWEEDEWFAGEGNQLYTEASALKKYIKARFRIYDKIFWKKINSFFLKIERNRQCSTSKEMIREEIIAFIKNYLNSQFYPLIK